MNVRKLLGASRDAQDTYMLSAGTLVGIALLPLVIVSAFTVLLRVPRTRDGAIWLLLENHPVELATFAFLLLGGLVGLWLAFAATRRNAAPLVVAFYSVFSLGLLFTAMEEVAWGQLLLGFEQPEFMRSLNAKGELTIHNIYGLDGRTEILRVMFGLGGLAGLWLARLPAFSAITPPRALGTWFIVIASLAFVDLLDDIEPALYFDLIYRLNELNEMLVGMAGLLFVSLNARRLLNRDQAGVGTHRDVAGHRIHPLDAGTHRTT